MQEYYRYLSANSDIIDNSSSGGAFTLLSDFILKQGGVVYGCVFDNKLKCFHTRSDNAVGRDAMRSSKYIQSDTSKIYSEVSDDLKSSRLVMFTGTPCQIAALKKYLSIKNILTDNLITVEVICHGVGSKKFFDDYVSTIEKKYRSKVRTFNFRSKYYPGQKQGIEIHFENGKVFRSPSTKYDWFYYPYHNNYILRPACYYCQYANHDRHADISISDLWGQNDQYSYSLIVTNSDKGQKLLSALGRVTGLSINEKVVQPQMEHPSLKPENYQEFWDVYLNAGYMSVQKWLGNNTLKGKIREVGLRTVRKFQTIKK